MTVTLLAIFGFPGGMEWIIIGALGLLIFGGRLPSVARSIGKSIVEFKRGLREVKNEIEPLDTGENRILPNNAKPADTEPPKPSSDDQGDLDRSN